MALIVLVLILMAGGFAGILLIEIISKTVDFYSLLKGDWDLAVKPKVSERSFKCLNSNHQANKANQNSAFKFAHPSSRFKGNPYEILGIKSHPKPSLATVKSHYRRLISLYHPDLYASHSEEILDEATRRAKIINSSYHEIRNSY